MWLGNMSFNQNDWKENWKIFWSLVHKYYHFEDRKMCVPFYLVHLVKVRTKGLVKMSRLFVMVRTMFSCKCDYVIWSSIKMIDRKIERLSVPCLQIIRFWIFKTLFVPFFWFTYWMSHQKRNAWKLLSSISFEYLSTDVSKQLWTLQFNLSDFDFDCFSSRNEWPRRLDFFWRFGSFFVEDLIT